MNLPDKGTYSIGEAAQKLGVSISTLRRWEREGKVSIGRTPGGKRAFTKEDLELLKSPIKTTVVNKASDNKKLNFSFGAPTLFLLLLLILATTADVFFFSLTPIPQTISNNLKAKITSYIDPIIEDYMKSKYTKSNVLGDKEVLPASTIDFSLNGSSLFLPTNQMVNSSFEAGIQGYSIIGQSTGANTKASPESVHSGTQGLKFEDKSCTNCQMGISQPINTTVNGRDYILSVWVRVPIQNNSTIRLGLFGEVSKSDPNYLQSLSKGELNSSFYIQYSKDRYEDFSLSTLRPNEWFRFQSEFSNVPLGKYPIIEVTDYEGGKIYIDDLSLSEGQTDYSSFFTSNIYLGGYGGGSFAFERNNIELADNSILGDAYGNLYPNVGFSSSIGTDSKRFSTLYLSKLTVDSGGNLVTSGNISAKDITASGNLTVAGTITTSGGNLSMTTFLAGNGTAAAPSYSFTNSTSTGLFRAAADALGISTGGTERLRISSSGLVGIGTTNPGATLDVVGNISSNGNFVDYKDKPASSTDIRFQATNAARTTEYGSLRVDSLGNFEILGANTLGIAIDSSGNVGIGTTGPGTLLDVNGNASFGTGTRASTGTIRLPTSSSINWRKVANDGDFGITNNGNNLEFRLPDGTVGLKWQWDTSVFTIGSLANNTYALSFNNNAATVGDIRLPNNSAIRARNAANTADPLLVRLFTDDALYLGDGSTTAVYMGAAGNFLFQTDNTRDIGASGANRPRNIYAVGCAGAGGLCTDIAENYPTAEIVEPGDLVAFSPQGGKKVMKAHGSYDAIGIVSSTPGVTLGEGDGVTIGQKGVVIGVRKEGEIPVALAGRVPTNVSTENGGIKIGDYLTSSSTKPGFAMKAMRPGRTIGIALDNASADGKIMVFVNPSWYDPSVYITDSGDLSIKVDNIEAKKITLTSDTAKEIITATSSAKTDGLTSSINSSILSRIDSLEKLVLSLTPGSAGSSSAVLSASSSATFETLNVSKKLITNDLGITGDVSVGLLSIKGSDSLVSSGSATINTLNNDLYIQNNLLGGINILNGKILIDKDGNLKSSSEITATKFSVAQSSSSPTAGTSTLPAGTTSLDIPTGAITANSKIFLTPKTNTGKQPLIVGSQTAGTGFTVRVEEAYNSDIIFNWWLLDVK